MRGGDLDPVGPALPASPRGSGKGSDYLFDFRNSHGIWHDASGGIGDRGNAPGWGLIEHRGNVPAMPYLLEHAHEIGRGAGRERGCQDEEISVGAVSLKKKKKTHRDNKQITNKKN